MIDYSFIPMEKADLIKYCLIPEDNVLNFSSHLAVIFSITLLPWQNTNPVQECSDKINWNKVTPENIQFYKDSTNYDEIFQTLLTQDLSSVKAIDAFQSSFTYEVKKAANSCFPLRTFKRYCKPYWDADLKQSHLQMRKDRLK